MPSTPERRVRRLASEADQAWVEISLRVPHRDAERAAAVLAPFAPGGAAIDTPFTQSLDGGDLAIAEDAAAQVKCYLPATAWPGLRRHARAAVARSEWSVSAPRLHSRRLPAQDWARAWQAHVNIVRVGRLVIRPSVCVYRARKGDVVVELEPGAAFGSGTHETTRMALAALEHWVRPGQRVLDFGSGSGILACAAARLGAAHVVAIDVDPLAVTCAQRNVARNGLSEIVQVRHGSRPGRAHYDIVIANLTAVALVEQASRLAAATRPGGLCVWGGIVAPYLRRVRRALRAAGLRPQETLVDGEWRTIRATRPRAPDRAPR